MSNLTIPTKLHPSSIFVIGLNASFQKTLIFDDSIQIGGVNRASSLHEAVGGKGQNFSLASSIINTNTSDNGSSCVLFQFHGEGKEAQFMIENLNKRGIEQQTVTISGQRTRTCTTLIANGSATEIIEPSLTVPKKDTDILLDLISKRISNNSQQLKAIAICGTTPAGIDASSLYSSLVDLKHKKQSTIVFVDAYKSIEKALSQIDILKINKDELCALGGSKDLNLCAKKLFEQYSSLKVLAITAGASSAFLFVRNFSEQSNKTNTAFHTFTFHLSKLSASILFPIGAGDVVGSVFLHCLLSQNLELEKISVEIYCDSFKWGLACASASCLTRDCSVFELNVAKELFSKIEIKN